MGVTQNVVEKGDGPTPQKGQRVTVHCTAYLAATEKQFWTTKNDEPFSFHVGIGQVIRGWDEGVLGMQLHETARLHLTADVAYGARGFPAWGIPSNADLIFEIQLLKIE